MKKALLFLSLLWMGLFWFTLMPPRATVEGASNAQVTFQTPTPGPDGRILYTVKAGDTCLSISLLTGVSVDELRTLNNLKPECVLQVNAKILLGLAGPAEATPTIGPSPTATPLLPTPTPFHGTGNVCIILFVDENGDGLRQDAEVPLADGQFSITDTLGKFSKTGTTTDANDPICFDQVPEGTYHISVGIPQGYNPTTVLTYTLKVSAGDQHSVGFGAQKSSAASNTLNNGDHSNGRSPLLGIAGGVILLAGLGLGIYIRVLKR